MKQYNLILKVLENGTPKFLKYRGVTKPNKLFQYLENKGLKIDFVNVYDKKTKQHIHSYQYNGRFETF